MNQYHGPFLSLRRVTPLFGLSGSVDQTDQIDETNRLDPCSRETALELRISHKMPS